MILLTVDITRKYLQIDFTRSKQINHANGMEHDGKKTSITL